MIISPHIKQKVEFKLDLIFIGQVSQSPIDEINIKRIPRQCDASIKAQHTQVTSSRKHPISRDTVDINIEEASTNLF